MSLNSKWLKGLGGLTLFLLIAWVLGTERSLLAVMAGSWVLAMLVMALFEWLERRDQESFEQRRSAAADSQE